MKPTRALPESPVLSGVLIVVAIVWLDWTDSHPFSAIAVGSFVATVLLATPDLITWLSRYRGAAAALAATASVASQRPVRVLARAVIVTGLVTALTADLVMSFGTDAEWPGWLGLGGIAIACLGLLFAVTAFTIGAATQAVVELARFDRVTMRFMNQVFGVNAGRKLAGLAAILGGVASVIDHRL